MNVRAWLHLRNPKRNNDKSASGSRFLVTINVFGSAGPIRFVVKEDESVAGVIGKVLKLYAREGCFPKLGFDTTCFLLYPVNAAFDALNMGEAIGSHGVRNFILCKNHKKQNMTEARAELIDKKKGSRLQFWKSLSLKSLSR